VLSPVARTGTTVALRLPRRTGFSLEDLVAAGSLDPLGAQWLTAMIRARLSFLISGGTGTGKTTVLAALLGLVPAAHRLVVLEDSAELAPDHPHVVALEARGDNVEGAGRITVTDLLRQALRMRPDRIVVGEVRGVEVVDLLAALNTGHEGGCGTVHANTAADVPARLAALAAPAGWDPVTTAAQAAAGLDAVIHLTRDGRRRRIAEVGVLRHEATLQVVPALRFERAGVTAGEGITWLRERLGRDAPPAPR
jgi:pilus assembly protein CpaF